MIKFFVKKYFNEKDYEKGKAMMMEMAKKSRQEKGCIAYDLYQDVEDPYCVVLLEEWEEEKDQEEHMKSSHFKELIPQINQCLRKTHPLTKFVPMD